MSGCGCQCEVNIEDAKQKKVLWWLLAINGVMFLLELGVGVIAQSTALITDSLDMLADAIVYGIGLYAVGRAARIKAQAALLSGWFQLVLGLLVLSEVIRLRLIWAHRHGDVNMRASWIFSANDVIANAGVIVAGALVWWLESRWPDLIIGLIIALVVLGGARRIIQDACKTLRSLSTGSYDH